MRYNAGVRPPGNRPLDGMRGPAAVAGIASDAITCIACVALCLTAYLVLQPIQFARWPQWASVAVTVVLWCAPTLLSLALLSRRFAAADVNLRACTEAIRERDMIRTLIDSLPDFIYVKDLQCRFLLANRFCCEAMGTQFDQLMGRTDFDFYPRESAQIFYEDEQSVIQSGQPMLHRQEEVTDSMGRVSTILTTKVPLRDIEGNVVGIMGIGRNITARVDAERRLSAAQQAAQAEMRERERMAIELRLAQKLESVGRLAAGLAHEINTPIQYVGDSVHFLGSAFEGLSTLLTAYREAATRSAGARDAAELSELRDLEAATDLEFLGEEVPRAVQRTIEGTQRVAGIVRAMKEFAHPDAGEHQPADLNSALNTTLTVARSEYRYAARLETRFGEIPEVVCNVGELNQVFLNLVVNSAHAIVDSGQDSATGVIRVESWCENEEVCVRIGDNGCGIAAENLDKVFDPFFTTKGVGRGTGQGLAISRSIVVAKHGGRIEASSELGRGTQFLISLPITSIR